jgi:predicted regulator of amino acid metabolism with ACT domain
MAHDPSAARQAQIQTEAAARVAGAPLESFVHEHSAALLRAVAADARLTEDLALGLLTRRDLPQQVLEELSKNAVMKSRKVVLALVAHPRTPRHVSLPIVRHLYTFELVPLALLPNVAADLKVASEEAILNRVETIAAGERLTLAKRASTRVAAALLTNADARVVEAALANPYLTESWVVKALLAQDAPQALVDGVCREQKWSVRREVRIALLRNGNIPLAQAIVFAQSLPAATARDALRYSRLPENVKAYLLREVERRQRAGHRAIGSSGGPA